MLLAGRLRTVRLSYAHYSPFDSPINVAGDYNWKTLVDNVGSTFDQYATTNSGGFSITSATIVALRTPGSPAYVPWVIRGPMLLMRLE